MDPVVRVLVIVSGIAALLILLILNKYVAKRYWLSAVENDEEQELTDN